MILYLCSFLSLYTVEKSIGLNLSVSCLTCLEIITSSGRLTVRGKFPSSLARGAACDTWYQLRKKRWRESLCRSSYIFLPLSTSHAQLVVTAAELKARVYELHHRQRGWVEHAPVRRGRIRARARVYTLRINLTSA